MDLLEISIKKIKITNLKKKSRQLDILNKKRFLRGQRLRNCQETEQTLKQNYQAPITSFLIMMT